jgi:hypothetical protein
MLRALRVVGGRRGVHWARQQQQQSSTPVFTSENWRPDPVEMKRVLDTMGSPTRVDGDKIVVRVCKLCDKGNKENADNLWKLTIWPNGGVIDRCWRLAHAGWPGTGRRDCFGRQNWFSGITIKSRCRCWASCQWFLIGVNRGSGMTTKGVARA